VCSVLEAAGISLWTAREARRGKIRPGKRDEMQCQTRRGKIRLLLSWLDDEQVWIGSIGGSIGQGRAGLC
jgi:hypothetical protein